MPRLNIDSEELLHWWEPKGDASFIMKFNWQSLEQLKEAVTVFLSSRIYAMAQRSAIAISENGCPRLQAMLASNPDSPADLLDFLVEVACNSVVVRVAENSSASKDTLSRLAFHEDPEVRSAVADNRNTPESCFKRLAIDESGDVRYRVAENPHAPLASLYTLLRDENAFVSQRARQTLSRILGNVDAKDLLPKESHDENVHDLSVRSTKHLIEELNGIFGCDVMTVEFSSKKAKTVS